MKDVCPHCGAPLQPEAQFCPHCMTSLGQKTALPAPKPPKKAALPLAMVLVVIALLVGGVFALSPRFKQSDRGDTSSDTTATVTAAADHSPLCSIEQFREAAPLVSEKMGVEALWDLDSLIDTHYSAKTKIRQYAIDTHVDDALLSLFFYNEGEEIGAYFCDVTPENRDKAEGLLKCVVQSACNYYFTDIDNVFDDEKRYPKKELPDPFIVQYTDMLSRTDAYTAAMSAGTAISSRYITMQTEQENIAFIVTTRDTDGDVLYDMAVEIERMPQ